MNHMRLRMILKGGVVQGDTTVDRAFSLPRFIAFLARILRLEPGDNMKSSPPSGWGCFCTPTFWMKPGDTVGIEADGIGPRCNPIVATR